MVIFCLKARRIIKNVFKILQVAIYKNIVISLLEFLIINITNTNFILWSK